MEWIPQLEFVKTVGQIFNGQLLVIIFNYLLVIGMLLEIGLLFRVYYQLNKIELRLERETISADGFLRGLVEDYQKALEKRKEREAGPFLEDYFKRNRGRLLKRVEFIENSPGYYLLAGFLGFFMVMLLALFNLDLEGLSGAEDFSRRLSGLEGALKTGGYTFLTGLFSSLILYLVTKAWGAGRKLVQLKEKLSSYLEDVVRVEVIQREEDAYQETLNQLKSSIEESAVKLEEVFEESLTASMNQLEGRLEEIGSYLAEYRELARQIRQLEGLDEKLEGLDSYQKEAASSSDGQPDNRNGEESEDEGTNGEESEGEGRANKTGLMDGAPGDLHKGEGKVAAEYKMVHACIRVINLEESIKFYQDAFGFEISSRRDFPEGGFTLVYLKGAERDFALELTYNYDRQEPYTIGNGFSHLAVAVADLDASYERHQEMGYKTGDIHRLSEGSRGFYFITDPDGYEIEVIQG